MKHEQRKGGRPLLGLGPRRALAAAIAVVLLGSCAWTSRVSVSGSGASGDGGSGSFPGPAVSADGRYVAFDSLASNLVPDADAGGVFVRDTRSNKTTVVTIRANGTISDGDSDSPAISADGRFVAFLSDDRAMVPGGTGTFDQIFVRDRSAATTALVSAKVDRSWAADDSDSPSISADGRYIAFESDAPRLVIGDTNQTTDVFVRDRVTGTTARASVAANGAESPLGGDSPSMSADGRYVAFVGYDALSAADTSTGPDVYVRDLVAHTTTLASLGPNSTAANGVNSAPAISGNGRFVAFVSTATNLDGVADTNASPDVFVRDLVTATTRRVSVSSTGGLAHGASGSPTVSNDGRFVAFRSTASDVVTGDTNAAPDAFVYDRTTHHTTRLDTDQFGAQVAESSSAPALSADGRYAAFATASVVPGFPVATSAQVYLRAVTVPTVTTVSPATVARGSSVTVTVTGSGFLAGATVRLTGRGLTAGVATRTSESSLTVVITAAADAASGPGDLLVQDVGTGPGPNAGSVGRCPGCLGVP